jgi:hypothetical protein
MCPENLLPSLFVSQPLLFLLHARGPQNATAFSAVLCLRVGCVSLSDADLVLSDGTVARIRSTDTAMMHRGVNVGSRVCRAAQCNFVLELF